MKLQNKVALITGSSRGMGKAIALLFAKEGAKVVVNYKDSKEKADEVVNEIVRLGSEAIALQADISNEEQVINMIDKAVEKFGSIDILVNNAGIVFDIPWSEKTVEQWQQTLGTNLIGMFLVCKYAVPHINEGGRIINTSSTNGIYSTYQDSMDYDASKAGVISITRSLAKELAPTILVNSIAPGWVDTDMNKYLPKEVVESETENIWLKRMGKPEEIANVALFLASGDSSFITGSTIVVDGGVSTGK
jgi:3-oxoacyl-[acyl-carrier protein] reductase